MAKSTVTQKVLSFLQSLQQSPQQQLEEELQYVVQEKKSHWEVSIAKSKSELARAKQNLNAAYRNADMTGIVSYSNQVANIEAGLEIIQGAFVLLFPVETV